MLISTTMLIITLSAPPWHLQLLLLLMIMMVMMVAVQTIAMHQHVFCIPFVCTVRPRQ
jgi:hypothetical protein